MVAVPQSRNYNHANVQSVSLHLCYNIRNLFQFVLLFFTSNRVVASHPIHLPTWICPFLRSNWPFWVDHYHSGILKDETVSIQGNVTETKWKYFWYSYPATKDKLFQFSSGSFVRLWKSVVLMKQLDWQQNNYQCSEGCLLLFKAIFLGMILVTYQQNVTDIPVYIHIWLREGSLPCLTRHSIFQICLPTTAKRVQKLICLSILKQDMSYISSVSVSRLIPHFEDPFRTFECVQTSQLI